MRIALSDGVVVESVGEDVLVLNPTQGVVERFDGDQAALMRELSNGEVLNVDSSQSLEALLDAGVVKQVGVLSRRRAVTLGAAAAGATFVSLSLPTAAMAQSVESPPFGFDVDEAIEEGAVVVSFFRDNDGFPFLDVTFEISYTSDSGPYLGESDREPLTVEFPSPQPVPADPFDAFIRWKFGDVISQVMGVRVTPAV